MTTGDFDDKVAVITGGARGIGLESARMILARGGRVALWDADDEALDRALVDLSAGDRVTATPVDISDETALETALGTAVGIAKIVSLSGCSQPHYRQSGQCAS